MKNIYLFFTFFFSVVLITFLSSSFSTETKEEQLSIQNGEQVYAQLCMDCHGENGKGEGALIGTALNNQQFLNTFSDKDIYNMINNGRPETMMPNFSFIEEREQREIVSYIRSWQTKQIRHEAPSIIEGNTLNGEKLYSSNCAMCHGETGSGLLATSTAIANSNTLKQMSDIQMWITIAYGREDTRMGPSLKGLEGVKQLEEQDISDIVEYIREELFDKYDPGETGHNAH